MFKKITLSGPICSGKSSAFKNLQKKLGWPSFSASEFFRDYCQKKKIPLWQAEKRPDSLTRKVDLGMRERLKKKENLILEGWMAGIMAQGIPQVLKVLLTAEDKERVKRFAIREKLSQKEAGKKLREREENLLAKLKRVYQRDDFLVPKNYDLVIDTTFLKPKETAQKILDKLNL